LNEQNEALSCLNIPQSCGVMEESEIQHETLLGFLEKVRVKKKKNTSHICNKKEKGLTLK